MIEISEAEVRGKKIGDNSPPYFVAELGICHEGSLDIAKQLVK
ncbi:MAG: N-acetylneuraminate synthase, partial [bacterium]|nr:N-acetylneuraminate synthase [bacterium]